MSGLDATASVRVIQPILNALQKAGVRPEPLLEALKMPLEVVTDPDARVPHQFAIQFWMAAAQATGDPAFGLHAAETLRPGSLDVADYAARSSATLQAGFDCFVRFSKLNHDAVAFSIEHEGELSRVRHCLPGGRTLPRPPADYVTGAWVVLGRQMTGVDWQPIEVHFSHQRPSDESEYRRLFGAARLHYGAPGLSMLIPREILTLPLVDANPGLCAVLVRHADELLGRMPKTSKFADQVRHLILAELQGGNPGVDAIAEKLKMSPSTLHRRLKAEGTSHRQQLEVLRSDLASRYLNEKGLAVSEVAFLLGFSEASAFHRAFKRWTGLTPAAFRTHGQASA